MNIYSDFYSRVQGAQRRGDLSVTLPWTHKTWRLGLLLKRLKFIENVECVENPKNGLPTLIVHLIDRGFSHLRQISKPSRKVFKKSKEMKAFRKDFGFYILSTPLGLLSCQEANALGVGGELLCEIY
uniref:Ribosomal protein S8 n=1 Tax=Chloropicon mariensis TaxID=1606511 RepID=A0A4D6C4T6_9CHLO|nr:ribosomal protein S8 [Chloropicon mariensis]QBX98722.1 ribosomal protein S8 [Chloropicon mariensis]